MNSKYIAVFLLLFVTCKSLLAAEYFVAPNGGKGAGTVQDPWSLEYANSRLTAGDTAKLRGGTYSDPIKPVNSGTAGARITYEAYPNETPVIDMGARITGWTKVSGTEGVDAVFSKPLSYYPVSLVEDDFSTNGRFTELWPRSVQTNRQVPDTTTRPDREASYTYDNGIVYVRTRASDNPSGHTLTAIKDNTIAISLANKNYITVKGIKFQFVKQWVKAEGSSYINIEDNKFYYANGYVCMLAIKGSNWIVRNNILEGCGSIQAHNGNSVQFNGLTASLFSDNELTYFGHNSMELRDAADSNIIRGNYIHHGFGKYIQVRPGTRFNVLEYNKFQDSPTKADLLTQHAADHPAIQIAGSNVIVRFNEFWNNSVAVSLFEDQGGAGSGPAENIAIYNNTIWGSITKETTQTSGVRILNDGVINPVIINNIIAENATKNGKAGQIGIARGNDSATGQATINPVWENNIIYSSSRNEVVQDVYTVDEAESIAPWSNHMARNLQRDPKITRYNLTSPDFRIQSDSPARNAGRYLTRTVASGSGNKIAVGNAKMFFAGISGNPDANGDQIRVGSNALVSIKSIDYASNVITVEPAITWDSGDGVSLDYSEQAPDIGAFEFGSESGSQLVNSIAPPLAPTLF